MDVVLVGLPGSGKSALGRRLAARHHAAFVDLDEIIERDAGHSIPEIFASDGESGFRAREREAVVGLGPADTDGGVGRVIATGGGAVADPRNRWRLYRGRVPVWIDVRPEVLAQRLRRSPHERPLIKGRDPVAAIRRLASERERFYAAAQRLDGIADLPNVLTRLESLVRAQPGRSTVLLRAATAIGRVLIGEEIAVDVVRAELERLGARRAIVLSEPGAWGAAGSRIAEGLASALPVSTVMLPKGEDAKRLSVVESTARELARLRVERAEPLVAIGGGALGDTAGFVAATYLRGVPIIHVPTTLVAQIDSSIGGKTAVDLPDGKNLIGAFHQPAAVVIDVALLRTLPERQLRAALGEAVKMALLGDERLFELLETAGAAIAEGDAAAFESGAVAELVERCAWAKVEVVSADEREANLRTTLNLGHSLGHAVEAAAGFAELLHGEAVAFGLRAACRIGEELGVTPPGRAARANALLDRLGLGVGRLPYPAARVRDALGADKKHSSGRLRWVLPTADGRGRPRRRAGRDRRACADRPPRCGCGSDRRRGRTMTRILVLQGPNLNLLGTREPAIYGRETLDEIHDRIRARAAALGLDVDFFQSNHEGALIDRLHQRDFDAAIVNAGGLTHTSVSLRDALLGVERPFVEVHLSDPSTREPFRHVNFLSDIAIESIVGQGPRGYELALEVLARRFGDAGG